ncbi:mitochondrial import inner membrane translocase subunit TIM22-3 [Selaginella moellendorffii]|nr:mitochondrial import inner membrane translocase subunit TIM22-3 [Selaginella moellendorffii]|eukprot:XP_002978457.2 mitochondrial import inner membrane translocase subunit TIM22-3 [Selaginella moellendorffii]
MASSTDGAAGRGDGDGDDSKSSAAVLPDHFVPESTNLPAYSCVIKGVGDAMSGAVMGSVFGFGTGLFQKKGFKGALHSGASSAKTFAILSGIHGFVTTLLIQIRGKKDAINAGIAGCATGIALSAPGNPAALLQGCATFGVFSYFVERMNTTQPAIAATLTGKKKSRDKNRGKELHGFPVLPPFTLAPAFMDGYHALNLPKLQLLSFGNEHSSAKFL